MRSLLSTLLIAIITGLLGIVALWQFRDGNLHRMLGKPPTSLGEKIFPDFDPNEAAKIILKTDGIEAEFIKTEGGWHATRPWNDRMDSRAALAIIGLTSSTIAEDRVPRDQLDPDVAGLGAGCYTIRIQNSRKDTTAFYRLGRKTPWEYLSTAQGATPAPTMYLLPLERGRKSHVYAATGDILPLLKDNFKFLRDHRPFYFNPLNLEKIRIKTSQGELTLGRASTTSAWRIVKPLDLGTDPKTMKILLESLYELQAVKVSDRSELTLPEDDAESAGIEIAIRSFGVEEEVMLEIFTPEDPEFRTAKAIVSDRPDTAFDLLIKTEPEMISVSDLPLTVNELRESTLCNLNIASVRGIAIESVSAPTILVTRQPPAPWMVTVNHVQKEANEMRLYELLKAVTETRAVSFVTDSAPEDLSPWGLDRPVLKLVFLAQNHQSLTLLFGLDTKGELFAKRKDSPSIMSLDPGFLEKIAILQHEWQHARLGSFNRVDLKSLKRQRAGEEVLELGYDAIGDTWKAAQSGVDVTAELDPLKANFLMGVIESLQVIHWLSADDPDAVEALQKPFLSFEIVQHTVDEFGGSTGEVRETLSIGIHPRNGKTYGRKSSDGSHFTLPEEALLKLNVPLLDE